MCVLTEHLLCSPPSDDKEGGRDTSSALREPLRVGEAGPRTVASLGLQVQGRSHGWGWGWGLGEAAEVQGSGVG